LSARQSQSTPARFSRKKEVQFVVGKKRTSVEAGWEGSRGSGCLPLYQSGGTCPFLKKNQLKSGAALVSLIGRTMVGEAKEKPLGEHSSRQEKKKKRSIRARPFERGEYWGGLIQKGSATEMPHLEEGGKKQLQGRHDSGRVWKREEYGFGGRWFPFRKGKREKKKGAPSHGKLNRRPVFDLPKGRKKGGGRPAGGVGKPERKRGKGNQVKNAHLGGGPNF